MSVMIINLKNKILKIHKTIDIFQRKKETMGLYDDEKVHLRKLRTKYQILQNQLLDLAIEENVIQPLITTRATVLVDNIKKHIPWDGMLPLKDTNKRKLKKAIKGLNEDDTIDLLSSLEELQHEIIEILQQACNYEDTMQYLRDMGSYIKLDHDDPLLNAIEYINLRYVIIASYCGVNLPEIKFINRR